MVRMTTLPPGIGFSPGTSLSHSLSKWVHFAQKQAGGRYAAQTFLTRRVEHGAMPDAKTAQGATRGCSIGHLRHDAAVDLRPSTCFEHVQQVREELLLRVEARMPLAMSMCGMGVRLTVRTSQCRKMSLLIFVTASRASRGVVRQPDTQHYLGGSPLLSPARLLKAAVGTGSAAASPMPAVINPLVAPRPPSPWRHCGFLSGL